jgi:ABC-2 type transport system permease protein
MIKDNLMDEGGRAPNAMFVLNLLDYLNGREEIALMRSKEQRFNPLMETGGGTRTFVKAFNIAGLPCAGDPFRLACGCAGTPAKERSG